jgi:uncharacterized membrane protein
MNSLHAQTLRNAIYILRGGFLVRPLAIALVLGFLGGISPRVEETYFRQSALRIFNDLQPQLAQAILSSIASGVMTVVSIVFAILLMSLTLASMQFSPRILIGFTRDQVTQSTLGLFLGTFSFCLCAMPSVKMDVARFVPVLTVQAAMGLALLAVVWLVFFIHHIAHSISVNYIVDRIASETELTIAEMSRVAQVEAPEPGAAETVRHWRYSTPIESAVSGYIRTIDLERLVTAARLRDTHLSVIRRVGHFVPEGVALLVVDGYVRADFDASAEYLASFDLGPTRSLQQDVEFGILQIVDIALRAISPAVNDPSTAINCVDQLGRILIRYARLRPEPTQIFDAEGVLRLSISTVGLERLVHSAFDQIRSYSKGDLAVSLRMLRALSDLAPKVSDPDLLSALATMGNRILTGCESHLEEDELSELKKRNTDLQCLCIVR